MKHGPDAGPALPSSLLEVPCCVPSWRPIKQNKHFSIDFLKSQSGCAVLRKVYVRNSQWFKVEKGLHRLLRAREKGSLPEVLPPGIRPEKFIFMLLVLL